MKRRTFVGAAAAGIPTFREAAALVHAEHKKGWKNGKHQAQWLTTLETYAFPSFGEVSVASVDAPAVRDAPRHLGTATGGGSISRVSSGTSRS